MSQNLLVERLKFAKRELTALKTAHQRGLGLLQIYNKVYYFSGAGIEEGGAYDVVVTIKFSRNFSPYPFAYVLGDMAERDISWWTSFTVSSIDYSDDGYTMTMEGEAIYYIGGSVRLEKITAFSTAPITSLICTFSG